MLARPIGTLADRRSTPEGKVGYRPGRCGWRGGRPSPGGIEPSSRGRGRAGGREGRWGWIKIRVTIDAMRCQEGGISTLLQEQADDLLTLEDDLDDRLEQVVTVGEE